jgi:hypothetical protein
VTIRRCLPVALALAACVSGNAVPGDAAAAASPDSLRGVVQISGSDPATFVVLLLDGGARAVALRGERAVLERLQGLEIVVHGEETAGAGVPGGRTFRVDRFAVRAAGTVPAADGTLLREGERYYLLVTADGRRLVLEHVPSDLADRVGAWVWISGTPGRFPDTFGVIRDPP